MFVMRAQNDLLADLRTRVRDNGARWSDTEVYRAINAALQQWQGRVYVPGYLESEADGVTEVELPPGAIRVLEVLYRPAGSEHWRDIHYHDILYGMDGRAGLLVPQLPSGTLRIIYAYANSPLPTNPATSSDNMSATASSVNTTATNVGRAGYVKIDQEWMAYSGTAVGTGTTLLALRRGLFGTTAAVHDGSVTAKPVWWGVVAPGASLFEQLLDQAMAHLHAYYLSDGAESEKAYHERYMNYFQQKADRFWQTWVQPFDTVALKLVW